MVILLLAIIEILICIFVQMHKIIVTYLTALILFQGMFAYLDVLYELNIVIEDYQLHKVKYGDNLTIFLAKHYGNLKSDHKEDHQRDTKNKKHPIQSDFNISQQIYVMHVMDYSISNAIEINKLSDNFYYQDKFYTFEKQKIFQPPQLA